MVLACAIDKLGKSNIKDAAKKVFMDWSSFTGLNFHKSNPLKVAYEVEDSKLFNKGFQQLVYSNENNDQMFHRFFCHFD